VGDRIHLRPPERADWPQWCELRAASREFLRPWEPAWAPDALSRAAFRRRLARDAAGWRDGDSFGFMLIRNDDLALLGGIGLAHIRRGAAESAEVGYWLGECYARCGYMTEALDLVIRFAFDSQQLRRLQAACLPRNIPSRRLLESAGFRQEGYAREYLAIDGIWQDHLLFGLLRDSDRRRVRVGGQ
jgi:ribosomal-protein-alanine N-acetyltransferase